MRFQGQLALVPVLRPAFVRVRNWDRRDLLDDGGDDVDDVEDDDGDDVDVDDANSSNI